MRALWVAEPIGRDSMIGRLQVVPPFQFPPSPLPSCGTSLPNSAHPLPPPTVSPVLRSSGPSSPSCTSPRPISLSCRR